MGIGVFRESRMGGAYQHGANFSRSQMATERAYGSSNIKQMTANAELSIFESQMMLETEKNIREDLKKFMRQDEQMVVFNSSAPRFQEEATHQIRVISGTG